MTFRKLPIGFVFRFNTFNYYVIKLKFWLPSNVSKRNTFFKALTCYRTTLFVDSIKTIFNKCKLL